LTLILCSYAVLIHSKGAISHAITLLAPLSKIIQSEVDSETTFRALVALGTLLTLEKEVKEAALTVYESRQSIQQAESRIKEPRIKELVGEIKGLL
jgi:phospholipase A-2-activating protein